MQRLFHPRMFRFLVAAGAVLASSFLIPSSASAKGCNEGSPARPVPPALWGELKPVLHPTDDPNDPRKVFPLDTTRYNGSPRADSGHPLINYIDIENGWIFASYPAGFQVWDGTGANATNPVQHAVIDGWRGQFAQWVGGASEIDQYVSTLDAPAGIDTLIAVAGAPPTGMTIWDTTQKATPVLLYQDSAAKQVQQVYAATINNRHYAFSVAATAGGDNGVFAYDMSEAKRFNRCLESTTSGPRNCSGVFLGRVGSSGGAQYIHGLAFGGRHFIVKSAGIALPAGLEIYDVTNPAAGTLVVGSGLKTMGVAMWSQSGKAYLATRVLNLDRRATHDMINIYDVTTCLTSGCSALPAPLNGQGFPVIRVPEAVNQLPVTFSFSSSTPFLFVGHGDLCHSNNPAGRKEYLLDVSNPQSPRDITPNGTIADQGVQGIDYWSWYYSDLVRGYSSVVGLSGKFAGAYFYRASYSIFDIHEWTAGNTEPPVANFTWTPAAPAVIYEGDPVQFTDTSIGQVTERTWNFPDGTPSSSQGSPVSVTFNTPGTKTVKLDVRNNHGPDPDGEEKPIVIVSAAPSIGSGGVVATPNPALVCQSLTFTAPTVTGKDTPQKPLTYAWEIKKGTQLVTTGNTKSFQWNTSASTPTGSDYTAHLTVSNTFLPNATGEVAFTLNPLTPLPQQGQFTPSCTNCTGTTPAPPAGSVNLSVSAQGATEWNWDFGDGSSSGWTTSPTISHSYTSTGQKQITVKVRNCVEGQPAGIQSAALTVQIDRVEPLVVQQFQAQCNIAPCDFAEDQAITFAVQFAGTPDRAEYTWGDGSATQTVNNPGNAAGTIQHTYANPGQYSPKVKLFRGTETVEHTHPTVNVSNSTPPPPPPPVEITISGPSTGQIGQALSFSASATGCTPSANWNWNASGGTLSGSGGSVQITWSNSGPKTVTVTNTGCAGKTGTKSVNIQGDTGGGGLAASFTVSPATPGAGQAVTFDASGSTGGPTVYSWDFGDGGKVTTNSATQTHTFASAGAFLVKLEVSKPSPSCPFGVCTASTSKQVAITGGPPPLVASLNSDSCQGSFGVFSCSAEAGKEVTFTDASTGNIVSRTWSFGDGATGTGATVKHTYRNAGNYVLTLTVSDGTVSDSITYNVGVTPGAVTTEAMVLPWIAKTVDGALVQSSDFYLHNPSSSESIDVTLEFRQRGRPENNPPKATRTIAPNATLFASDVVKSMFGRENITGFIAVNVDRGSGQPVLVAFNTTFQDDGSEFGQTIPGYLLSNTGAAATTGNNQVQHLVGLNDNGERLAYFGLSNPTSNPATYRLRFFNSQGQEIGTGSQSITLSRHGFKQYQVKEIRSLFGVEDQDDYRVVVESARNTSLFPYGANLRLGSGDPAFVSVGSGAARVHLLGALSTPGANNSVWRSDLVLANTGSQVVIAEITFTNVGPVSTPTDVIRETLQPGETRRLDDVIGTKWNIRNGVGVLTIDSDAPGNQFPVIQGESYETTNPAKRYGQTLPALTDTQAAGPNQGQYLVGLRQDAKYRTTFWIFNPSNQAGQYDVVFRALDGRELGTRLTNVTLGPGKLRQFNQAQFPAGVGTGFTVQILVKQGKVLAAAQVVNNATNDPAYIQGETR